ncbi:hypothetical protein ACFOWE_17990 [Planomonospora corallina]|uniref:Uncharacterized protein n=1 Tax=Planomonospora corallina TaxID=1806052 RepID=A0ABV8I885_9ACTN
MPATSTTLIPVTLQRAQWKLIISGIRHAVFCFDGPGWCWCPDTGDDDICDDCATRECRAYEYRDLAGDIARRLGGSRGLVTLALSASTWTMLATALTEGADHTADNLGADCVYFSTEHTGRVCDDCRYAARTAQVARAHAARITRRVKQATARPARAPRAPRGTRARTVRH